MTHAEARRVIRAAIAHEMKHRMAAEMPDFLVDEKHPPIVERLYRSEVLRCAGIISEMSP